MKPVRKTTRTLLAPSVIAKEPSSPHAPDGWSVGIPRAIDRKLTPSARSPPVVELSEEGFIGQLRTDALLAFLANLTQRDHAVDRHF
jgi:hypothetical protein